MEEEKIRLKIPASVVQAHRATPGEWANAIPPMSHRSHPQAPLIVELPGDTVHHVELRVDKTGKLFLELKD
jgi:hypothetical protein